MLRTWIQAIICNTCLSMPTSSEEGTWVKDGFRVYDCGPLPLAFQSFPASLLSLLSSTFSSGASSDSSHSWRRKPCSDAWSSLNIVFQGSKGLWEGTKIQELVLCDQKRRESGNLTRKREALLSTPSVPPDWILLLPSRKRSKCITNLYSHYNKSSLWCKSAFKSETCVVRIITICSKKPH